MTTTTDAVRSFEEALKPSLTYGHTRFASHRSHGQLLDGGANPRVADVLLALEMVQAICSLKHAVRAP